MNLTGKKYKLQICGFLTVLLAGCGGGTSFDPCAGKTGLCTRQGELRCSEDKQKLEACQKDTDGCLVWQVSENCAAGQKTCDASGQSPQCVSQCQDLCGPVDAIRCQDSVIQRCQPTASGCLGWVTSQDCGAQGKTCDDSVTPPVCAECQSECTAGALRCLDNVLQECGQVVQNCFQWRQLEECAADGAVCQDKVSPPSCVQPCQQNDGCELTEYCLKESCGAADGFCQARPGACAGTVDPVCGCDGQTYSNACLAAAAGVNVDHPGTCNVSCHSDAECKGDEYCHLDACTAETGTCRPKPTDCGNEWMPVCGCNGLSYPNECHAARSGMNIDFVGLCFSERCLDGSMCSHDGFCQLAGCQPGSGQCEHRPTSCSDVVQPVCGCDGKTYDNACWAARAGVSVAYEGRCPKLCSKNDDCLRFEFCFLESCNYQRGVCRERPTDCGSEPDAVCGCDGKTYTNECLAHNSGMNVDRPGACNATLCRDNQDCAMRRYYCYKRACKDETGWCVQGPNDCQLPVYAPVCACDGNSYNNECEARLAGQNIDHPGKCEGESCFVQGGCYTDDLYCWFSSCAIETGECLARPAGCEMIWQPVCGCDKSTYPNECFAAAFGASVDYPGECR